MWVRIIPYPTPGTSFGLTLCSTHGEHDPIRFGWVSPNLFGTRGSQFGLKFDPKAGTANSVDSRACCGWG